MMENLELLAEVRADFEESSDVAASVAVVGGRPQRHEGLLPIWVLVTFHEQLVAACNQF